MDDLKHRLRDASFIAFDDGGNDYTTAQDALSAIEALEAEVARWRKAAQKGCFYTKADVDAMLKEEREKALREALTACDKALFDMQAANPSRHDALPYIKDGCDSCKDAIIALIEKDADNG